MRIGRDKPRMPIRKIAMADTACCDADVEEREKLTESQRGAHRSSTLLPATATRSCDLVANSGLPNPERR
jgi:hypothetical protein